jgi:hypothetical protein
MGDFNNFLDNLKKNLSKISDGTHHKFTKQIVQDGIEFAQKLEPDLESWEAEYSIHQMTKEEFEELVKSKKELLEMEALKKEDLPGTELNKIRNAIVETVTETAVKVLL